MSAIFSMFSYVIKIIEKELKINYLYIKVVPYVFFEKTMVKIGSCEKGF